MCESFYSSQYIDEVEHKMKAKLDRETKGKKRLTGLSIQLKGRIRGVDRSKKMQLN